MGEDTRLKTRPGATDHYPVLAAARHRRVPHMIVPLFVGREKSINALEEVMRADKHILLAAQKNAGDDDPGDRRDLSRSARSPPCCSC